LSAPPRRRNRGKRHQRRKPKLDAAELRLQLRLRGISVRAVALRLGTNQSHLLRVFAGTRPGSHQLLDAVGALIDSIPIRHVQEEDMRLINAAVHMFFLKRGKFDSEVCHGPGARQSAD